MSKKHKKKAKTKTSKFDTEIRSTYVRIDADERQRYDPPEHMLQVSVVGDMAFLNLVSLEESHNETHYRNVGGGVCVDTECLLSALGYSVVD